MPRRVLLLPPVLAKRARIVISNSSNGQSHQMEKSLSRLLNKLCLLESNNCRPSKSVVRAIAKLNDTLISGSCEMALIMIGHAEEISALNLMEENCTPGPIKLAGLEFHGFVPGCGPASLINSLRDGGWPHLHNLWEHDLVAAFDTADLSILWKENTGKLRIPLSMSLVRAVMSSGLIERRALLSRKVFLKSDFAAAAIKQFPFLRPGLKIFSSKELIQGSPLSPILFIFYLAATSLGDSPLDSPLNQKFWIYGDNVYSKREKPPQWINCRWKSPVLLGCQGKTLGLDYRLVSSGRLLVSHHYNPYSEGVQRKLDLHWTDSNER